MSLKSIVFKCCLEKGMKIPLSKAPVLSKQVFCMNVLKKLFANSTKIINLNFVKYNFASLFCFITKKLNKNEFCVKILFKEYTNDNIIENKHSEHEQILDGFTILSEEAKKLNIPVLSIEDTRITQCKIVGISLHERGSFLNFLKSFSFISDISVYDNDDLGLHSHSISFNVLTKNFSSISNLLTFKFNSADKVFILKRIFPKKDNFFCAKCGEKNHLKKNCTHNFEICYVCSSHTHTSKDCDKSASCCVFCHAVDHLSIRCPFVFPIWVPCNLSVPTAWDDENADDDVKVSHDSHKAVVMNDKKFVDVVSHSNSSQSMLSTISTSTTSSIEHKSIKDLEIFCDKLNNENVTLRENVSTIIAENKKLLEEIVSIKTVFESRIKKLEESVSFNIEKLSASVINAMTGFNDKFKLMDEKMTQTAEQYKLSAQINNSNKLRSSSRINKHPVSSTATSTSTITTSIAPSLSSNAILSNSLSTSTSTTSNVNS
jgi:hypothetical protein